MPPGGRRADTARVALWLIAATAMLVPVLTVRYIPVPNADVQLYASIARARQLFGVGVPTMTWNSPTAVDHIPFYGPVFFDLVAASFHLFGPSLAGFRAISLFGTALYVLGTVLLAREFSGSSRGPLLAAVLVLISPELNAIASTGAMHMLALGFEVLALAAFVKDFDRRRSGAWRGALAGLFLALAALTTPRSYPFVFGFFCAGLVPTFFGSGRLAIRHRFMAALMVFVVVVITWAGYSHGTPAAWVRYLAFIFMHEDTDVAILPTAVRTYGFHLSSLVSLVAVLAGSFAAALSLSPPEPGSGDRRRAALVFLLVCVWVDLVAIVVTLNYTFLIAQYVLLPALAVLVAWPWDRLIVSRRVVVAAVMALMAADGVVLARRYADAAVSWKELDPEPISRFVREHVSPGSTVVGPEEPFFFAVEAAGSRYRTAAARSWADWARWVPIIEPEALLVARRFPVEPPGQRFLIWPAGMPLPAGYECALPHLVATYQAPVINRASGWVQLIPHSMFGYPTSALYRLPAQCPAGYDPTRPPGA